MSSINILSVHKPPVGVIEHAFILGSTFIKVVNSIKVSIVLFYSFPRFFTYSVDGMYVKYCN
jgi:hypothetical protein